MKQQENGVNAPATFQETKSLLAELLPRACSSLISAERLQQPCTVSCGRARSWRVVNKIFRKALARPAWQRGLIGFLSGERREDRPVRLGPRPRLKNVQGKREEPETGANTDFPFLILTNLWNIIASCGFLTFLCFLCLPVPPSPHNGPSPCYDV